MLILPTEKRFDWQYAPVMLFLIVALNILIFLLYQSSDSSKYEQALETYQRFGLLEKEWPAFEQYLKEKEKTETLEAYRSQIENSQPFNAMTDMVSDGDFYQFLLDHSELIVLDAQDYRDTWQSWRDHRRRVNAIYDSISSFQFGLIPKELNPLTLVSYQFLHGNFMHLIGNMVFLVFCGFAVEAAIGPWLFLLLYLGSGVGGGLLYALLDTSSAKPLVGASAAISGVMAMYLGVFRLRKIEFFYWILVFAGYFRAPALLILPVYVAKEIASYYLNPGSNVAFLAHAGGFLCGFVLLAASYRILPQTVDEEYIEADQDADPERIARAEIYALVDKLNVARAIAAIENYLAQYGNDFELLLLYYGLLKSMGNQETTKTAKPSDRRNQAFSGLVELGASNPHQREMLARAWRENPEARIAVPPNQAVKLALDMTRPEFVAIAEEVFQRLYYEDPSLSRLDVLARKLSMVYESLREPDKSAYYRGIAEQSVGGMM